MKPLHEHYNKIYRYCYFRVQNAAQAEDITQETFLRFFETRNYVNRGKPLAYLYTVARNLCADAFRRPPSALLTETVAAQDADMARAETAEALKQALGTLPPEAREVLLLRYANELSMAEISAIAGVSRFALRRMINGALKALRQVMDGEDFN